MEEHPNSPSSLYQNGLGALLPKKSTSEHFALYFSCRAPARQHTILDDDRGFSQSSLDPVFCPDLCIVEISICVCLLRCRISGGTNSATFVEAKGLGIDKHLFCFAPHFLPFGHSIGMNSRATHRYKMRAMGSRPSARPKHWQPVNGSQFIIKLYYRPTSSSEKNAFFLNQPTRFRCRGIRGIKRLFD